MKRSWQNMVNRRGFTLVEALVATAVLGINFTAMVGTLMLVFFLFRSSAAILEGLGAVVVEDVCSSLVIGGSVTSRWSQPGRGAVERQRGLTLIEILIALTILGILTFVTVSLLASVLRGRSAVEAGMDWHLSEHALRLIIEADISAAGSGLLPGECGIEFGADGHELQLWSRDTAGELLRLSYAAGVDRTGRSALYRRRHPHARQPWLEDVVSFRAEEREADVADTGRIIALSTRLSHGGRTFAWRINLPHHPCIVGAT